MSAFCALPDSSSSDHHFNHPLAAATAAAAAAPRPRKLLKSSIANVFNVNVPPNQHPTSSSLLPCSSQEEAARINNYADLGNLTDIKLSARASSCYTSDSTYKSWGAQLPQDANTMLDHHIQINCNTNATHSTAAFAGDLYVATQSQPLSSVLLSDDETLMTAPNSASSHLDRQSYSIDDQCSHGPGAAAAPAAPELISSCGMNPEVLDMLLDSATGSASMTTDHVGVNVPPRYSANPDPMQPSCAEVMDQAEALLAEQINNCKYDVTTPAAVAAAAARYVLLNPPSSERQPQSRMERPIKAAAALAGCIDKNLEVLLKRDEDISTVNSHNNSNSNSLGAADIEKEPNYVAGKVRVRARRGEATDVHSISERNRRIRITDRMKALQKLVPHSTKTNKAAMLDQILQYVSLLQLRLKCACMRKVSDTDPAHSQRLMYHVSSSSSSSMEEYCSSTGYYSNPDRQHEYNIFCNNGAADQHNQHATMITSINGRGLTTGPRLQGYLERVLDPLEERISEAESQFTRLLNGYNDHRENERLQEALQFLGGYGLCLVPVSHVLQRGTAASIPSNTAVESASQPATTHAI